MENSVRAFWAVPVPDEQNHSMDAWLRRNWPGNRNWVPAGRRHITLHFFKKLETDSIETMGRLFQEKLDSLAPDFPDTMLQIQGLGTFPKLHRARVLWAGVESHGLLASWARALEAVVQECGYAPEKRQFHPHLTLSRIKKPLSPEERQTVQKNKDTAFASFPPGKCILYKSVLKSDGPVYTPLLVLAPHS